MTVMDEQQKLIKKLNRRLRFTQFIAWMALFFTAVGIAAGYKNWLRIHTKAKANVSEIKIIQERLPEFANNNRVSILEKNLNENLLDNKTHLESAMKELRSIQDSTQHIAETVYTQVESLTKQQQTRVKIQTPSIKDWSLGEVHFLLQAAIQRFNLKQDKKGAIAAFKLADSLLLKRGSLELLPIRKQISLDIALINQHATVDVNALSQQINNLLELLKPVQESPKNDTQDIVLLPTKSVEEADEYLRPAGVNTTEKGALQNNSLVARVKKTINDAVVIRKYNKPIMSEMDIEAKERIYQLLSLRLETLRLMLLQGDNKNYHQQIQRIKTLIKSYYPEKQNKQFQQLLDQLNKINLAPGLPDISKSLSLLEEIMSAPANKTLENKAPNSNIHINQGEH